MAVYQSVICTNCKWAVGISGPHEFFRKKSGEIETIRHPIATEKQVKNGVSGSYADGFCGDCGMENRIILREYESPIKFGRYASPVLAAMPDAFVEMVKTSMINHGIISPSMNGNYHMEDIRKQAKPALKKSEVQTCKKCGGSNLLWGVDPGTPCPNCGNDTLIVEIDIVT